MQSLSTSFQAVSSHCLATRSVDSHADCKHIRAGFPLSFGVFQKYYSNNEPFASEPSGIAVIGTSATVSSPICLAVFLSCLTAPGYHVPRCPFYLRLLPKISPIQARFYSHWGFGCDCVSHFSLVRESGLATYSYPRHSLRLGWNYGTW